MLVLAATYRDERLQQYISGEQLRSLLDRTISWLGRLAPISQTCKADCWILQRIRGSLFSTRSRSGDESGLNQASRDQSEASCGSEIAVARRTYAA